MKNKILKEKLRLAIETLTLFSKGEGQANPSKIVMNRKAKEILKKIEEIK